MANKTVSLLSAESVKDGAQGCHNNIYYHLYSTCSGPGPECNHFRCNPEAGVALSVFLWLSNLPKVSSAEAASK